tara:strand:- start:89 stop:331 length:243 start_codon:yes stop_codon:yes gene_type:complete
MPVGTIAVVPSPSVPFNVVSNPSSITMTTIRTDDPGDLLPSELDPWPPSDEEIEEREKQALFDDYMSGVPDPAERNRNLK